MYGSPAKVRQQCIRDLLLKQAADTVAGRLSSAGLAVDAPGLDVQFVKAVYKAGGAKAFSWKVRQVFGQCFSGGLHQGCAEGAGQCFRRVLPFSRQAGLGAAPHL